MTKQHKKIGVQKQRMKTFETEYIIQQHYAVTVDESDIEHDSKEKMFHRMFQAIMANEEALKTVLEYRVVVEHDMLGDGTGRFIEEHYGKEVDFFDILILLADYFTQEDREWLLHTKKDHDEAHAEYKRTGDDEELFDLGIQVEELEECFKVKASGYAIGEHVHAQKDHDHH